MASDTQLIDQVHQEWRERNPDSDARLDVAAVVRQLKMRIGTRCTDEIFGNDLGTLILSLTQLREALIRRIAAEAGP